MFNQIIHVDALHLNWDLPKEKFFELATYNSAVVGEALIEKGFVTDNNKFFMYFEPLNNLEEAKEFYFKLRRGEVDKGISYDFDKIIVRKQETDNGEVGSVIMDFSQVVEVEIMFMDEEEK